jgi:hypothetical protein
MGQRLQRKWDSLRRRPSVSCEVSVLPIRGEKREGWVERSTQAVVDLKSIAYNVAEIRKKIGDKRDLMAVVKADG